LNGEIVIDGAFKASFLMSMLFDRNKLIRSRAAEDEVNELAVRLGLYPIGIERPVYSVAAIKVEEADALYQNMGGLLPVCESVFGRRYACSGVFSSGKLVYFISGSGEGMRTQLSYLASELVQRLERMTHMRCSIGISEVWSSLLDADKAYEEASFVLKYLPDRTGGVYFVDDILSTMELNHSRLSYIVSKVDELLKVGTKEELQAYMEELLCDENTRNMPKANVMMLCIQLGFCIHKAVYEVSDSPEADKFLTTQLIGSRVFPTREYVLRMSLEAKDIISNQRKQNSEVLCDRAMHIIENEYGDETLSLANISERLHVSASYLSAILRKNRGDTFVNLLTAKRMTAAREFLMCTSMKIMEVARRCGYSDQHYFSYCFKRYYGTSPNKIRKNVKDDQTSE